MMCACVEVRSRCLHAPLAAPAPEPILWLTAGAWLCLCVCLCAPSRDLINDIAPAQPSSTALDACPHSPCPPES
jgi:hypothetical protein